jgi:hypothetical protein
MHVALKRVLDEGPLELDVNAVPVTMDNNKNLVVQVSETPLCHFQALR